MNETSMPTNVGCRTLEVVDAAQGAAIPLLLLYPTLADARTEQLQGYALDVARDASPEGRGLPLVVLSHGTGSSPMVFRALATHLSRCGFVMALVTHPGNHRDDNRLAFTAANLENRPRHVRLVIDAVFGHEIIGPRLSTGVAVIGHSQGGYTALALAGGRPKAFANESPDGVERPVPVTPDPRVKALVLLAPATAWFLAEGALADVGIPILMRSGELDEHATAIHAQIVERGLGDRSRLHHRIVPNAGHFSFLTQFPAERVSPAFPPSQDPPGFDRSAFLLELEREVAEFLSTTLRP